MIADEIEAMIELVPAKEPQWTKPINTEQPCY